MGELLKSMEAGGFLINLVLIGILFYFLKVKPMLMRRQGKDRRVNSNPGPAPGNATVCKQNREKLIRVCNDVKWIKKFLNIKGESP